MTRSAEGNIELKITSKLRNVLDDESVAEATIGDVHFVRQAFTSGVSAEQFNRAYSLEGALTSGNTTDIDLYDLGSLDLGAGAGMDGLGLPMAMEEVVLLVIRCTGGAGQLEVQPTAPSDPATWIPSLTASAGSALRSGGVFVLYSPETNGYDVFDGSSHQLRLGASGGDVTYQVVVVGRSDDDESSSSSSQSASSRSSSSSSSKSSSSSASSRSSSSSSDSSLSSSSSSSP